MEPLEEISSLISGPSRVIVIASADVDLRPESGDNAVVLLKMTEGSLASGGRGGGFGERKIVKVAGYERRAGSWSKLFEADDEQTLAKFEVPYYVSRIPLSLPDGTESMGYGVVEPELVSKMLADGRSTSSP